MMELTKRWNRPLVVLLAVALVMSGFALVGAPQEVLAASETVYVDAENGDDETNDGSEASPFATIKQAFDSIVNQGTIVLLNDVTLSTKLELKSNPGKNVTIQSEENETYTIKRDENFTDHMIEIDNRTGAKLVFKDLIIDGSNVGVSRYGVYNAYSDTTFENVEIKNHHITGGAGYAVISSYGSGSTVTIKGETKIHQNTLSARNESNPQSILGAGTRGVLIIEDGLITDNTVTGVSNGVIIGIGLYQSPSFQMTGGIITDNNLHGQEHNDTGETVGNVAVYMRGTSAQARFEFKGTPYVYDNLNEAGEQRNVFLKNAEARDNAFLSLVDSMQPGAKVGVYANIMPTHENPIVDLAIGYGGYEATQDDAIYFESDLETSAVVGFDDHNGKKKVVLIPVPRLESAWMDKTEVDGKDITFIFSDPITLEDLNGFNIEVNAVDVTNSATFNIDAEDARKLIITLADEPNANIVVTYTEDEGNLKGVNGIAVEDFTFTYDISFATDLNITTPSDDPAQVTESRPELSGTTKAGSTVSVIVKDKDENEVAGAGGDADVDENGEWSFELPIDLDNGTYTFEVTATSPDGKIAVTKIKEIEVAVFEHPTGNAITSSSEDTSYTELGSNVTIDNGVTLDSDILKHYLDSLDGATVMIENKHEGDVLAFEETEKIKGNYDAALGVLTLTAKAGETPTIEEYEAALRNVTFATTSTIQDHRQITFALGTALAFENGHFYDYINKDAAITWHDAKAEAEAKTYFGRQGYLVTITSEEESSFVIEKTQGQGWIGAADIERIDYADPGNDQGEGKATSELGDWRWVTGPEGLEDDEKGLPFYTGYSGSGGEPFEANYNNWQDGEPNNDDDSEWVAHIYGPGSKDPFDKDTAGQWNDFSPTHTEVKGYVIEYGGMDHDAAFIITATKTIEIEYVAPKLIDDGVLLEQTETDGNKITLTFDQGISLTDLTGFTVKVGEDLVTITSFEVDPTDDEKLILTLPAETDVTDKTVNVSYDGTGNLKGTNGAPVGQFDETAEDPFAATLTITTPTGDPAQVAEPKPHIKGTVETGSTVTVVIKQGGHPVAGASGPATVDGTGNWTFTSDADLSNGDYTIEVTATKDGKIATTTKDMTINLVDKRALQAEVDLSSSLDEEDYTAASWSAFQTVLTSAQSVLSDDDATQVDVDTAKIALENARVALVPVVDKTALQAEVDLSNSLNEADYTATSWNDYQDALADAEDVLDDDGATQVEVDSALDALQDAKTGLVLKGGGGTFNPPAGPQTEIIVVDVIIGGDEEADVTRIPIQRTTEADGRVLDEVTFTPEKAEEAVDKAKETGKNIARIVIPDEEDQVSEVNVDIPLETAKLLQENDIDLEIYTENAVLRLPNASLDGIDEDFYFRLVPVKDEQERSEIEERARVESVVRVVAGDKEIEVVARPMTIETNLSSRPVTLILPLKDVELPVNETEREAFLSQLGIFIEHSDGDKKLVRGKVVTYNGGWLGLEFSVTKFSTFTIINFNDLGSHEAYIVGFPDGEFKPDASVTRAQLALMMARNLGFDANAKVEHAPFKDVATTHYAANAIAFVQERGIMNGDPDGSFRADDAITRAEMATVVANYLNLSIEHDGTTRFNDTSGHWAHDIIEVNLTAGVMEGYPDGSFRPKKQLTRAEAVKIINHIFDRGPLFGVHISMFPDVSADHWAYEHIQEAALDHAFYIDEELNEQFLE